MRSLISRSSSVIRPLPLIAFVTVSTAYIGASAQPAAAANNGPINDCTTTNAIRGLVRLIVNNVVNPFKTYGWAAVGVVLLIAVVAGVIGASAGGHWKKVFWGFALMVVVIPLVGVFFNAHVGPCRG